MAPTPPGTDRAALRLLPAPTPVTWREEILTGTSSICTSERAWERERGEAGWELQPLCGLRLVRRQQCCRGRPGGSSSGARMPWGSRELSDARAVLQSTAVYCSLLQSIRRFLVTDGRVCGRDVRSSEGVWGRREPSKVHSRLHRLHEFVQRLNHCSPAVAGSARSAMQNGGGGLAGGT